MWGFLSFLTAVSVGRGRPAPAELGFSVLTAPTQSFPAGCAQTTCPEQPNPLYSGQSQPRMDLNSVRKHPNLIQSGFAALTWAGLARQLSLLCMKMFQLPGKPFLGITGMHFPPLPWETPLAPCQGEEEPAGIKSCSFQGDKSHVTHCYRVTHGPTTTRPAPKE